LINCSGDSIYQAKQTNRQAPQPIESFHELNTIQKYISMSNDSSDDYDDSGADDGADDTSSNFGQNSPSLLSSQIV
jgi:hypothetical protein